MGSWLKTCMGLDSWRKPMLLFLRHKIHHSGFVMFRLLSSCLNNYLNGSLQRVILKQWLILTSSSRIPDLLSMHICGDLCTLRRRDVSYTPQVLCGVAGWLYIILLINATQFGWNRLNIKSTQNHFAFVPEFETCMWHNVEQQLIVTSGSKLWYATKTHLKFQNCLYFT